MKMRHRLLKRHSDLHSYLGLPVNGPYDCLRGLAQVKLPEAIKLIFKANIKGVLFKDRDTHKNYDVDAVYDDGYIVVREGVVEPGLLQQIIIHEVCHQLQDAFPEHFLENGEIINEFSLKRIELMRRLTARGYNVDRKAFLKLAYDPRFDDFLSNDVKSEDLSDCIKGLFPSPYSIVSLEEYISLLFEEFFEKGSEIAKGYSKEVTKSIEEVMRDYYENEL